ncbi:MAG: cation diffusion facilitator family transporter [Candidatus Omnitrophota bacterium]|nr:cation diffusion facilitator family transporter [Candidatus Omnitrophota bacterium]
MERNREVRKILVYILALNWLVALAKLAFGFMINSASMIADGFHSFADGLANIVGLVGIHLSCQPIDKDHPYGHKKYETFTAIFIAILLFLVCFNILHDSIERIKNPIIPKVNIYSFLVMIVTMLINIFVMRYEFRCGKRLNSDILVSDSMHTRTDIFTSCAVIIALIASKSGLRFIDPIGSMVIAGFIAYGGIEILQETSRVLCDAAMVDIKKIEKIVMGVEGVAFCHKIRTRGRPDDIHIDLHVQVSNDMHITTAHKLSYKIEDQIKKKIPGVVDVVVHMEPLTSRDKEEKH